MMRAAIRAPRAPLALARCLTVLVLLAQPAPAFSCESETAATSHDDPAPAEDGAGGAADEFLGTRPGGSAARRPGGRVSRVVDGRWSPTRRSSPVRATPDRFTPLRC